MILLGGTSNVSVKVAPAEVAYAEVAHAEQAADLPDTSRGLAQDLQYALLQKR